MNLNFMLSFNVNSFSFVVNLDFCVSLSQHYLENALAFSECEISFWKQVVILFPKLDISGVEQKGQLLELR